MEEIWRPVKDFKGKYEVSTEGRIRSVRRLVNGKSGSKHYRDGQILKPQTGSGYQQVYLTVNGKQKWFYVHRLVAEAFIPNPDNKPMINHKDENPFNNCVLNLEWCDSKYNCNYGSAIKRNILTRRNNFNNKLKRLGITREEYNRIYFKEYYAKNREKILERYHKNKLRDCVLT